MKFATFSIAGTPTWGIIEGETAVDLGAKFADLKSCIAAGALGAPIDGAERHSLAGISWLPVIPNPEKILCVGLNYEMHRQETGRDVVAHPTIFARFASSQTGHLAPLVRPRVSTELDFEGELALIIGKPGRYIKPEAAFDHIAGYACYNDGSVRDWQRHTHQFIPGKNFPGTGAFGPWMVTPDEIADLDGLRLQTRVNGAVVQEDAAGSDDFRYSDNHRLLLVFHAARTGRRHRHRHPRRRRRQTQAAAVAEVRRRGRGGNRCGRPAAQYCC